MSDEKSMAWVISEIESIKRRMGFQETLETPASISGYTLVPLTTPLTSTSWDGDAHSDTSKTKIDLSSVFGAPAGIKAIAVRIGLRDSASAGTNNLFFGVSPNNTSGSLAVLQSCGGLTNDWLIYTSGICPCDANGDIYFQCNASGTNTMDVWLEIWGYWI